MTATQGRANRRRGADAERAVVRYLASVGYDARRYLAGDGKQPGDVDWHPLVVLEVKDVKNTAWPTWCRQANAAAAPDQIPVVVRRKRGETNVVRWPARLPAWAGVAGRAAPIPGLYDMWVQTNFASVVLAVARDDDRDDIAEAVHRSLMVGEG